MAASQERLSPGLRRPVPWTLLSYGTLESVIHAQHHTEALEKAFSCCCCFLNIYLLARLHLKNKDAFFVADHLN